MSTINPTSNSQGASGGSQPLSSLTNAADQQDRFMKLLVAQMKNQDPLNPMDNAQMTSQIAQINTVAGIEKLNGTVASLLSALQGQSAMLLPGRDVLVPSSTLSLDDSGARGGVDFASAVPGAAVEILGADGSVVRRIALGDVDPGVRTFEWDGHDASGNALAAGPWNFRITSGGGIVPDATPLSVAQIQSAAAGNGTTTLDLGAASVPLTAVRSFIQTTPRNPS